ERPPALLRDRPRLRRDLLPGSGAQAQRRPTDDLLRIDEGRPAVAVGDLRRRGGPTSARPPDEGDRLEDVEDLPAVRARVDADGAADRRRDPRDRLEARQSRGPARPAPAAAAQTPPSAAPPPAWRRSPSTRTSRNSPSRRSTQPGNPSSATSTFEPIPRITSGSLPRAASASTRASADSLRSR